MTEGEENIIIKGVLLEAITSCKKYSPNVRLYHIQTALGEYFF